MSQADTFREINDPILSAASKEAPISLSTRSREQFIITTSNALGTVDRPLNGPNSVNPVFSIDGPACKTLRWNNCALRLRMNFTRAGTTDQPVPQTIATRGADTYPGMLFNSPSWNLAAQCIREVVLHINGHEFYRSSANFSHEFAARLFRNYSFEALEAKDETLLTPLFSSSYTAARNDAAWTDEAQLSNAAGINYNTVRPGAGVGFMHESPYINAGANGGVNYLVAPHVGSKEAAMRARKYCSGATHQRTLTRLLYFRDLFPTFPDALFSNISSIKIEIKFTNTLDLLEHSRIGNVTHANAQASTGLAAGVTYNGQVNVFRADLVMDSYSVEALQQLQQTAEKAAGTANIIPLLTTECISYKHNNGEHYVCPARSNIDAIMVMKPARGLEGGAAGTYTYQADGEYALFNAGESRYTADQVVTELANARTFIDSFQMRINNVPYPSSALELTTEIVANQRSFDPSLAYMEYKKACRKLGTNSTSVAVPYSFFSKTMPFIMLRWHSDECPHRSNGPEQIIIQSNGGPAAGVDNCLIIMWRYIVFKINADGSVIKMD